MPPTDQISNKSLMVSAFAAYHQLQSGQTVREVIAPDGVGHSADPEAIEELGKFGLVVKDGNRVSFIDQGETVLDRVVKNMRQTADDRQANDA